MVSLGFGQPHEGGWRPITTSFQDKALRQINSLESSVIGNLREAKQSMSEIAGGGLARGGCIRAAPLFGG
jgi:hypothetical protein